MKYEDNIHDFIFMKNIKGADTLWVGGAEFINFVFPHQCLYLINFLLRKLNYDEVHFFSNPIIFDKIKFFKKVKYFYEINTGDEKEINIILNKINKNEIYYVVHSKYTKKILKNRGIPEERIQHKNIEIDTEIFNPFPIIYKDTSAELIPVLWVGTSNPKTNFNDFVKIISLLGKKYYGIAVINEIQNANMVGSMIKTARLYNCDIKFLTNLNRAFLPDLYKRVRNMGGVFCSTSLENCLQNEIIESLMCGLNVIAYDSVYINEFSEENNFEISHVNFGDLETLIQKLINICENINIYNNINKNNIEAYINYSRRINYSAK